MTEWSGLFASHREGRVHRDEVIHGVLHPEIDPETSPLRELLRDWPGTHYVHESPAGVELTLVRRVGAPTRERWWLHLLLFVATLFTTTLAGSFFAGRDALRFAEVAVGWWSPFLPIGLRTAELVPGLLFSVPLLLILLAHEMGHYLTARRRGMDVSPPYFIPAPIFINFIGTFGAFIRLRSPLVNRTLLLEVGAAGPVVSFLLSIPVTAVGLAMSTAVPVPAGLGVRMVVPFASEWIPVGGSLAVAGLAWLFAPAGEILLLHPVAFAGWLGFFVTALNLFPIFQLDGGHIAYALLGSRQRAVGLLFMIGLVALGTIWEGWWIWAVLILVLGRGSVAHPPVLDPLAPVSPGRRALGWACLGALVLTFTPAPFPF